MEGSHAYISNDMLVEILSRLPVKSLMQLKCVCRSWYQIISTTSFINAQKKSISNTGYLLCTHSDFFSLICKEESTYYHRKYNCKPELFESIKICVYGSCNGLLCVSQTPLIIKGSLYLFNPIIRKGKKIPTIPFEVDDCRGDPDLCLGYFDDDYKVIMITLFSSTYRVGVYSLTTDNWKITDCGSTDGTINSFSTHLSSVCVNGVAYFVRHGCRILCFDLHKEMIREVEFPESNIMLTTWNSHYMFSMEACGDSIALLKIGHGHMIKWILRNCSVTNTHTWEKKINFNFNLGTPRPIYRVGFTNDNTYVLRDDSQSGYLYLCDIDRFHILPKVHVKDLTCEEEAKEKDLLEMYPLVENLVLLNEDNLDPFVEIIKENTRNTKKKEGIRSSIFKLFKVFNCFNRK